MTKHIVRRGIFFLLVILLIPVSLLSGQDFDFPELNNFDNLVEPPPNSISRDEIESKKEMIKHDFETFLSE